MGLSLSIFDATESKSFPTILPWRCTSQTSQNPDQTGREKENERNGRVGNLTTALAAVAVVLSTFSASQYNFAGREQIFRNKADALINLKSELVYMNPPKREFIYRFNLVRSWNDGTTNTTVPTTVPSAE